MCASPLEGGTQGAHPVAANCRAQRAQGVLLIESASPEAQSVIGAGPVNASWTRVGPWLRPIAPETHRPGNDQLAWAVAEQAAALQRALPKGWRVVHAIHGGRPTVAEALESLRGAGAERVVVIPMRPQYTAAVSGSELGELYRCLGADASDLHVEVRAWWHDDSAYIDAHARLIHACACEHRLSPLNSVLVFLADGTAPEGPEAARLEEAAELLLRRLGWPIDRATMLVTSPEGRPSLREAAEALGADDRTGILVCPITHMAESGEFLERLGAMFAPCRGEGQAPVHICPAPGASEDFIKALALLVRRGRQPSCEHKSEPTPLIETMDVRSAAAAEVGTLIMAGVCVDCTLGRVGGPVLNYCTHEGLKQFKRPHLETVALLKKMGQTGLFRECWIWNTCSRYEFYAWLPAGASPELVETALRRALEEVLGPDAAGRANLLRGRDAWHHALRTAAGLNSALVGDAEVVEQLQAARGAAQLAGTADELTDTLIQSITRAVRDLRDQTAWGRYAHRYCDIALSRLSPRLSAVLAAGKCLVIGGSTTSCSVLEALSHRFGVPHDRVSLIYRGFRKGTLARRLHNAAGPGHLTIVNDYSDREVQKAMAGADAVFFALDQRQSITSGAALAAMRDLTERPMTLVDFNTFGSASDAAGTAGLTMISAAEVEAAVAAFNSEMLHDAKLGTAVAEAERWISSHIQGGPGPRPKAQDAAGKRNKEVAL